jgi:FMN reductase (NADPH)
MSNILHNATVDTLLERRSIRKFKPKPLSDDIVETLETVAQHAASSQFLNDWSAIRITDPAAKKRLAEIGGQPYIATAPLLYVFVLDEHRNAAIAASKGVETASDEFTLNGSYRYTQAQNDAVLALHAMETAAYSLGLGCVILGSLLNDVPALIDLLNLPEYTTLCSDLRLASPIRIPHSSRVCRAPCSSLRMSIRRTMRRCLPVCRILTRKCIGITICAIPSAQLIRSAIRSRRMRSIPV